MQVLLSLLGLSDLLLATVAFALVARPELALGAAARVLGQAREWREGRLDEADEQRLLRVIAAACWPLLALLFGWSFVCGATIALARM